MFRPRVIPTILIDERGHAVKTRRFKRPLDLGDPVNITCLFNDFQIDELIVLDIAATRSRRKFPTWLLTDIASEAAVPLSLGGGIRTFDDIETILKAGAEKVVIGAEALASPEFVRASSERYGSSTIAICIDVKRDWRGRYRVITQANGKHDLAPIEVARSMADMGAGELIVQSIDNDGMMAGYDLELTSAVADAVGIPVVALGGAGEFQDLLDASKFTRASAFAAGSLFCFQDRARGVLIQYPGVTDLAKLGKQ